MSTAEPPEWARRALEAAEADLEVARRDRDDLARRIYGLEKTISGLRVTLGMKSEGVVLLPKTGGSAADRRIREANQRAELAAPKRRQSFESSTIRVLRVLLDVDGPMSTDEIIRDFAKRGWMDESWSDKEGAVAQAIRRCYQYGYLARSNGNSYFLAPAGAEAIQESKNLSSDEGD